MPTKTESDYSVQHSFRVDIDSPTTDIQPGTRSPITNVNGSVRPHFNLALRILSGMQGVLGAPSGIRLAAVMMLAVATALACYLSPLAADVWEYGFSSQG